MAWFNRKASKPPSTGKIATLARRPLVMALEPRVMFDGAIAATVAEVAQVHAEPVAAHDAGAHDVAHSPAAVMPVDAMRGWAERDGGVPAAAAPTHDVLFVDARIQDAGSLLAHVSAGTEIVYLQQGRDGLQQMSDYLAQHPGADSVQILAHGNDGDLWLGSTYLSADNIGQHANELAQIGAGIKAGGDLLIYACDTAAGAKGLSFVTSLADLTQRDVAASSNRIGAGYDWNLEISTGHIEAAPVLAAVDEAGYAHDLAIITVTTGLDSGVDATFGVSQAADLADGGGLSLREALQWAQNNDTITFSGSMTVTLSAGQLVLAKNLTIDGDLDNNGTPDVTIDANYSSRVFNIGAGQTVTLDGLVIEHGLVVGNGGNGGSAASAALGGGIFNAGNLTLKDVTVTANAAAAGGGGGGVAGAYVGGGGGGGGGIGGGIGGTGGSAGPGTGTYAGVAGSANTGGRGGGYDTTHMGGRGGTSSGGAGGIGSFGYTNGGNGGTASNGSLSIGGGGGGSGWDATGGVGGKAVGGIYNASTGVLSIIGTSVISNNLGAGGGGGGGDASGTGLNGGDGGLGVGAILNNGGTVHITAANYAAMTGNAGGSGSGGAATGGGSNGATPSASPNIATTGGGTTDTNYNVAPTLGTVTASAVGQVDAGATSYSFTISYADSDGTINGASIGTGDVTVSKGGVFLVVTGATWNAGTSTATYTVTPAGGSWNDADNGSWTIGLVGSQVADNGGAYVAANASAGGFTVSMDTTAPAAPGTPDLAAGSDTGSSSTDNITSDTTPSFTGTAEAGATVTVSSDLDGILGTTTADGSGNWSLTATSAISAGTHAITVIAADAAGNTSSASSALSVTIDTAAPAVASVGVPANATYITGDNLDFTVNFNEAVTVNTGGGTPRIAITLDTGGVVYADYVSGSGTSALTFRYTVASGNLDTNGIAVGSLSGNGGTLKDAAGNDATLTLNSVGSTAAVLVDAVAPTVSSVGVPSNGTYAAGANLDFTVNYSEAVTVNTGGGTPRIAITLDTGGTVYADYVSGSGTSALTFRYTVGSGTLDTNGITVGALSGNGGTLKDVAGNDAALTLNSVGSTTAVLVDGIAPSVSSINRVTSATTNATSVDYTVTFAENVTGVDASDFALTATGTATGTIASVTQVNGSTYTVTVNSISGDGTMRLDLNASGTGIADTPGNAITAGYTSGQTYSFDHTAPAVASVGVPANATYIAGDNLDFIVNFNEAVTVNTGGGTPRIAITLDTGGVVYADYVSGSGTSALTFRYTVAAGVADANGIAVGSLSGNGGTLKDAAGNDATLTLNSVGSTAAVLVDAIVPTASIVVADTSLAVGETTQVTITFSEAVSGFSNADLSVANGSLSAVSSSDGGVTWTATFTPTAGITDASNLITLNNTGVQDMAGNTGTGTTDSNNYAIDNQVPAVTAVAVPADGTYLPGQTLDFTVSVSEAVTVDTTGGTPRLAVTLDTGGTVYADYVSGSGTDALVFRLTVQSGELDTNGIVLAQSLDANGGAVHDAIGNALDPSLAGVGATSGVHIDAVAPTVIGVDVPAAGSYQAGTTLEFTVHTSEAVLVDAGGQPRLAITLDDGGVVYADYAGGSGTNALTFRYLVPAGVNDADGITLGSTLDLHGASLHDAAGNALVTTLHGSASTAGVIVDTTAPEVVSISRDDAGTGSGQQGLSYTVTFSEDVGGVDAGDFLLVADGNAHATIDAVTRIDGHTYVVHLQNVGGTGSLRLDLAAGGSGIADVAGNALAAGAQGQAYVVGGVAPVILPPMAALPPAPAFTHDSSVSLLSPLPPQALPTIFFGEAAPARTFELPTLREGGVLDGLATLNSDARTPSAGYLRDELRWLPSSRIEAGHAFSVRLPLLAVGAGDRGILQVTLVDGRPLPAWLHFDPVAGTFEGVAPSDFSGALVQLTVRDRQGLVHGVALELAASGRDGVKPAPAPRARPEHAASQPLVTAKPALQVQFGQQRHSGGADHAALLHQLAVARQHHVSTEARR